MGARQDQVVGTGRLCFLPSLSDDIAPRACAPKVQILNISQILCARNGAQLSWVPPPQGLCEAGAAAILRLDLWRVCSQVHSHAC